MVINIQETKGMPLLLGCLWLGYLHLGWVTTMLGAALFGDVDCLVTSRDYPLAGVVSKSCGFFVARSMKRQFVLLMLAWGGVLGMGDKLAYIIVIQRRIMIRLLLLQS